MIASRGRTASPNLTVPELEGGRLTVRSIVPQVDPKDGNHFRIGARSPPRPISVLANLGAPTVQPFSCDRSVDGTTSRSRHVTVIGISPVQVSKSTTPQ